jgi:flagellar protein FlgJ
MIDNVSINTGALADPKAGQLDKLKAAAKQFEAVFARQMLKSAHDAKLTDDDVFGSDATDQFREMQDSNLADQLAGKGALGVADLLIKQFAARLGNAPASSPGSGASTAATPAADAIRADGKTS